MYKALMATEPPLNADDLRRDLQDAGLEIIAETTEPEDLISAVIRSAPDVVIAASLSPSDSLFEAARMLGTLAPCALVLFTADHDSAKIIRSSDCNIHAYVVDGYARHRLPSIIELARARFRHEQGIKDELRGLSKRFEERKIVDRAKGMLMRSRKMTEDQAFELLRNLAMQSRQRIGVVAQGVIDMSRAGEAVNRSGQLRMLSQRIVLHYAQVIESHAPDTALQVMAECALRVEANLGILRKAIMAQGYGELVDRVAASWADVRAITLAPPKPAALGALDRHAERMLSDAENLTGFLEASGLVASLHILNVAGRQRMVSQRIAKLCFLLALDPMAEHLTQLQTLRAAFQTALDYLCVAPLSSPLIRDTLNKAIALWQQLDRCLDNLSDPATLAETATIADRLLAGSESLADQYEQAMQLLMGERIGTMT